MEGQGTDLLALAMQECLPHQPNADRLQELRERLASLTQQIEVLKEEEEDLRDQVNREGMALEGRADAIYALLAKQSRPSRPQADLLAAILHVMTELEKRPPEDLTTLREQAEAFLATPINTPVLYGHQGVWYGGRTFGEPYLIWHGDEWWLQFPLGNRATGMPLDSLLNPEVPSLARNVFVGLDRIRSGLEVLTQDDRLAADSPLQIALAMAGCDPSLFQI